tara:strand:- start:18340 stop:19476 length:1137 start_codon:yes stop_codon:yes gene_type:complete
MKIAFDLVSATHGGGFSTYNKNIFKQLLLDNSNKDQDYFIFTNDRTAKSNKKNINLIYISNRFSNTYLRFFWIQFILPIHLFYRNIDSLFSPMNILPIFLKYFNIKKILVIHSNLIWLYPEDMPGNKIKLVIQKLFTNISINIADKIIVDSEIAKKELITIFNKIKNKVETVYLGADNNLSFKLTKNNNVNFSEINIIDDTFFLTISSAVRYHCINELIIAYNELCEKYDDIPKYLILSKNLDKAYFMDVKKTISLSKFSKKIVFMEDVDTTTIPLIYKNSSLYIFSSYCEVFGLTNLEAMFYEVPVITSNRSAIPEICGNAAVYFDPKDTTSIKNKILDVYFDDELQKEMIRKGKEQVRKFTWLATYNQTKNIILNA